MRRVRDVRGPRFRVIPGGLSKTSDITFSLAITIAFAVGRFWH